MYDLNRIIEQTGLSKVKIAKYLGVSRQMLYNYLSAKSFNDIPSDKRNKLLNLLGANNEKDLGKIYVDNKYIQSIETKINNGEEKQKKQIDTPDFKGLHKEEQAILTDMFNIIKERLINHGNEDNKTIKYLYYYIQYMESMPVLKYILAYMAKSNLHAPVDEYAYDRDKQYTFEGILFSAMNLYNNDNAAPSRVAESHKKFEMEIENKKEEKLSRTEELNSLQLQALKELGYNSVTESNANEVFEKFAEIITRKF